MSKAAKIRELYAQGLTTRQIADRVGCRTEYVRVVARQRIFRNGSIHDMKWRASRRAARMANSDTSRSSRRQSAVTTTREAAHG